MTQSIETLNEEDIQRIEAHREWVVGHFEDAKGYEPLSAKLRVIQAVLDNGWAEKTETWKLQSLGIALGDALVQEMPQLSWVAVEDEFGRDPALRWLETTVLIFPLTAISKRVEDDVAVDAFEMFGGFLKTINDVIQSADP
ncbi:DUF3806 domain-containing protein [Usitatibacter palustris]|uniref:DUF3806 domain-containing protein n=1 Tax=Usitatibacter palustris TaxID=2732487 RepID=A0A6M4HBR5_9PROT|nr:DUF3806 domain-containing protein [Usitatibacter palustris]QJR16063.1 hypothetical protein DSM104440_02891 [Usitatibacter palustris]